MCALYHILFLKSRQQQLLPCFFLTCSYQTKFLSCVCVKGKLKTNFGEGESVYLLGSVVNSLLSPVYGITHSFHLPDNAASAVFPALLLGELWFSYRKGIRFTFPFLSPIYSHNVNRRIVC